jgi:hypothetical protein
VVNTIDKDPPTSSIDILEGEQFETFKVTWSSDDGLGSGVESYDIFYAVDGAAYQLWREDTELDSWFFDGELGKTYTFYSVATDKVGFVEAKDPVAEMTLTPTLEGSNYLVWAKIQFGLDALNDPGLEDTLWGENADPDGDDLANGLEFYTGADPLMEDSDEVKIVFSDGNELVLQVRQSANAQSIILVPEASNELGFWSQQIVTCKVIDVNGQAWLEARTGYSELVKAFIRLRIVN